jgi:CO dehydrogenase/acetyl-CoA synthase beta subunit
LLSTLPNSDAEETEDDEEEEEEEEEDEEDEEEDVEDMGVGIVMVEDDSRVVSCHVMLWWFMISLIPNASKVTKGN